MKRELDARAFETPLFEALVEARQRYGGTKVIIEDQDRKPLDYNMFIAGSFALSRLLKRHIGAEQRVGLMLPTSMGGALSFWALHALGRAPVMINFTAGQANIKAAAQVSQIKTVITARRFIENAKLEELVEAMRGYVRIIYLDDIRKEITLTDKVYAFAASKLPRLFAKKTTPDDIGVILFTSGSFGSPRGVVLSQRNLVANVRQIQAHIALKPEWVAFNPMPIFHSLGLTGGVILPLLAGLRSFQYPSPLHVKQIPPLLRESKASLLFATDTFINQYARQAEPDDFKSLEFVVCGAEKVRNETHELFKTQFGGVPILEGYGVTECSPVVAVNYPDDNHYGTVGPVLPGIETRLDAVEGIKEGGRLFVKGPNVMAGYINPENPNVIEAPKDGWHDTGDIVTFDDSGFIKILGRAKRFAKIAGEMVSLTAVERLAEEVWPDNRHAVVAVSDDKKGERLVLITDNTEADMSRLTNWAKENGTPALAIPKKILKVEAVPVLGSGKTDYVALQKLAEVEVQAA
ncbi:MULTISPECIES: AMP-binding protein [Asticcacaulis]|uniref:AMP-binding protein n=1 Tax=Asticcacaulis TaxID=76890 RepID=UPI001AE92966|nr:MULTISPECIES: AMP-binding protein [Asticcacaulis]MBP2158300.1 acyl-[acyl-carrier-protein]-phospholipid O-acyltransferase/long-chain-fatty-acid--[acyl-carrier-protein] ligase [Asticcacaulis solisilvae]MDR6799345.1 acyl-[acyl-carrier-protein]-phospholipid O-acyltransferase/long-chain-fatty-acid--[acyl-carrier-protein] ligase [Asticcacaulis sp. BE141]